MSEKLIKLCRVIGKDLSKLHKGDTLSALWPFTPNEAEYYVGSFWIEQLEGTITKLKEKRYSRKEIAELFGYPSKIAQYFTLFHSAKVLDLKKRIQLATDLLDYIDYYREDPFCENGANILKKQIIDVDLLDQNPELLKIGDKLTALMLLYLEILYPTMMRLGHEFHGPYKIGGKNIFVKDFHNLQPLSLGIEASFPFNNIKIVEEIEGNVELDFFNHLVKSSKKKAISISINGNQKNLKELKEDLEKIENSINQIIGKIKLFDKKDWFKVYARGIFNSSCKLNLELGKDCKPPKEVFKKIDEENFSIQIEKIVQLNKSRAMKEIEKITTMSFLKIFELI